MHRQPVFFLTPGALRSNEPGFQTVSNPELCAVIIAQESGKHAKKKTDPERGKTNFTYGADTKKARPSDKQLIASALSAAPAKIAKGATVVVMDAAGKMRRLREGSNGFTCMPDNPATPGPDPMRMDKNSMERAHGWIAHQPPPSGKVGFM